MFLFILENMNSRFNEYSCWKTPSLQFQCVVPMQTWRIVFSGHLRLEILIESKYALIY